MSGRMKKQTTNALSEICLLVSKRYAARKSKHKKKRIIIKRCVARIAERTEQQMISRQYTKQVQGKRDSLNPLLSNKAQSTETDSDLVDINTIIADIEADDDGERILAEEVMPPATPERMLKGLRLREGLTQKAMAEKLGIKQYHIAEMEKGKRKIGLDLAKRIGKIFNTSHQLFL